MTILYTTQRRALLRTRVLEYMQHAHALARRVLDADDDMALSALAHELLTLSTAKRTKRTGVIRADLHSAIARVYFAFESLIELSTSEMYDRAVDALVPGRVDDENIGAAVAQSNDGELLAEFASWFTSEPAIEYANLGRALAAQSRTSTIPSVAALAARITHRARHARRNNAERVAFDADDADALVRVLPTIADGIRTSAEAGVFAYLDEHQQANVHHLETRRLLRAFTLASTRGAQLTGEMTELVGRRAAAQGDDELVATIIRFAFFNVEHYVRSLITYRVGNTQPLQHTADGLVEFFVADAGSHLDYRHGLAAYRNAVNTVRQNTIDWHRDPPLVANERTLEGEFYTTRTGALKIYALGENAFEGTVEEQARLDTTLRTSPLVRAALRARGVDGLVLATQAPVLLFPEDVGKLVVTTLTPETAEQSLASLRAAYNNQDNVLLATLANGDVTSLPTWVVTTLTT